jgi:hypothetical protein
VPNGLAAVPDPPDYSDRASLPDRASNSGHRDRPGDGFTAADCAVVARRRSGIHGSESPVLAALPGPADRIGSAERAATGGGPADDDLGHLHLGDILDVRRSAPEDD